MTCSGTSSTIKNRSQEPSVDLPLKYKSVEENTMREMRRFKQALTREQCHEILNRGTSGVLAVAGEDGWPYAVPLIFPCAPALFSLRSYGSRYASYSRSGWAHGRALNCGSPGIPGWSFT